MNQPRNSVHGIICKPRTNFILHLTLLYLPRKMPYQFGTYKRLTPAVRDEVGVYYRRYFQHAHFIPIVGVGKRGEY